ncbi:hypothetical protein COOONC_06724 [Cooperia oncophora]
MRMPLEVNQRLALYSYQLDSVPSPLEMAQYHKRLIELYNEMASRTRQTKQYITLNNTLVDVNNFLQKEFEMLTKIEEILPQAKQEAYRDSFIDALNTMNQAIEGVYKKVSERKKVLLEEKARLTAEYNEMNEERREFNRLVELMKVECERNQKLRRMYAQLEREEAAKQRAEAAQQIAPQS